jgi:hypothetical protein
MHILALQHTKREGLEGRLSCTLLNLYTNQELQEASVIDTTPSTTLNIYPYNSKTDIFDLRSLQLHNYGFVYSLYNECSMERQESNEGRAKLYEYKSGSRIERMSPSSV